MKILQEIERLLASENGEIKVNKFCELQRITVDHFGNDVDVLRAVFQIVDSFYSMRIIKSRKPKKIVKEIIKYQEKAFKLSLCDLKEEILEGTK